VGLGSYPIVTYPSCGGEWLLTTDNRMGDNDYSAICLWPHSIKTTITLQTFLLTPATKVAVDRSVVQPYTNFTYVIKSTNVCE